MERKDKEGRKGSDGEMKERENRVEVRG